LKNIPQIIDAHFGDGYSSVYFEDGELKKEYRFFFQEGIDAFIIYSRSPKIVLNFILTLTPNQGHGVKLLDSFKEEMKEGFLIPVWDYYGSKSLVNWILKNGGVEVKVIKNYWTEDSIKKRYQCKICGNPCVCSMRLFEVF